MPRDQDVQPLDVGTEQVGEHVDPAMRFEIASLMISVLVDHLFRQYRLKLDHCHVAQLWKVAGLVEHIRNTARHARRKVAAGLAQHHHNAAGHVFAAMVAGAFDDCHRT